MPASEHFFLVPRKMELCSSDMNVQLQFLMKQRVCRPFLLTKKKTDGPVSTQLIEILARIQLQLIISCFIYELFDITMESCMH